MKILAFVFCYNRPQVLAECARSILEAQDVKPDHLEFIDDCSPDPSVFKLLMELHRKHRVKLLMKDGNRGFSDSAEIAISEARELNPEYLWLIESDYVFAPHGLDVVMDVFEHTEQGKNCLGIVGYDHPNFRHPHFTNFIFPSCMKAQVGEDNVYRLGLHRNVLVRFNEWGQFGIELVSNTCFSCYLNWKKLREIEAEFPELTDLLDQACAPRDNPNYPQSGEYRKQRVVDDGMLSHAISLVWNRWAIKHGIDRNRFGAWLNIRPSIAEHRHVGGMHG